MGGLILAAILAILAGLSASSLFLNMGTALTTEYLQGSKFFGDWRVILHFLNVTSWLVAIFGSSEVSFFVSSCGSLIGSADS